MDQQLPANPRSSLLKSFARLLNSRIFQLCMLMLWALLLNREGVRVPNGNEWIYLLYFYKAWHANFLNYDWTFQETSAGHAVFNYATGWITLLMPLQAAAWFGRIICWWAAFIALLRLGTHYKIPSWAVWVGIVLWLAEKQAPITMDWIIGTFEAKVVAYVFLLLGIDAALGGKNLLAGILCGLSFSFHTAVGMWGGGAVGLMVLLNNPMRQTLIFSASAIILALPGFITSLPLVLGKDAISASGAKFLVTVALPSCLESNTFPRRFLIVLPMLVLFGGLHALWLRRDRQVRMLFCFEAATFVFFLAGLAARVTDRFGLVVLYPMRVFAVFVLLLFFWQFARLLNEIRAKGVRSHRGFVPLLCFGFILFFSIPSPLLGLCDLAATHFERWKEVSTHRPSPGRSDDASFKDAAQWVSAHVPQNDLVIAPPWRADCFYYGQRPLIANWHSPRYDQMDQWRMRIEDLVGDVSRDNDNSEDMGTQPRAHYVQLTTQQTLELMKKYASNRQGCWLITTGSYPFAEVYKTTSYRVYRLR